MKSDSNIISLGIESTAHTFSIGIVEENRILTNERVILTTEKGGIHPREAAELHAKHAHEVFINAIHKAGFKIINSGDKFRIVDVLHELKKHLQDKYNVTDRTHSVPFERYRYLLLDNNIEIKLDNSGNLLIKNADKQIEDEIKSIYNNIIKNSEFEREINLISYAAGPGLYPTLVQGKFVAELINRKTGIDIIGVNHLIAHIESVKWFNYFVDPVVLLVSGANTMLATFEKDRYVIIGETLDMGVGNFLDKVARLMGLGFPGGPKINKLAKNGKNLIELPYTVKGMDVQFGGLYTYIKRLLEKKDVNLEDLAFSIEEYVYSMLTEISERALSLSDKKEFGVTGGVSANQKLREKLILMCGSRNVNFGSVPIDIAVDNGAMIAITGILWKKFNIKGKESIDPYWRPETVVYPKRIGYRFKSENEIEYVVK